MTVEFAVLAISERTFLDWADAIGVPIIVVVIAGIFVLVAQKAGERAETDRELQLDRTREETLRSYLDRISDLVLERSLIESAADSPERAIALARTRNALNTLDGPRKGLLVRFLNESRLIRNGHTVIPLFSTDLTSIDLSGAVLRGCDFSGANSSDADLYNADLSECNLEHCVLTNEQLAQCAQLSGAILPNGDLATEQSLKQLQIEDLERWS